MCKLLEWEDILITRESSGLTLKNSRMSRTLNLELGAPRTVSLLYDGLEMAAAGKSDADLSFIGMTRPGQPNLPWQVEDIQAETVPASRFEPPQVRVTVIMAEPVSEVRYQREYTLYPGLAAIVVRNAIKAPVMPNMYWSYREYNGDSNGNNPARLESCADSICPANGICARRTVAFTGRTDYSDDLVQEYPADRAEFRRGNLLYAANDAGAGFLYLQEAPPSAERRDFEPYDFRLTSDHIYSCCWGLTPSELHPDEFQWGYRHVLIPYASAAEAARHLKDYLRVRFPSDSGEDGAVMINPWGCGRFPELLNRDFLTAEIRAAAQLGATCYQIDDGWQSGRSLGELSCKNRHITPDFWTISTSLLDGSFRSVVEEADAAGIKLGLWLAPSCNCEYRDWRDTAEMVWKMYCDYGFHWFKIDAVKIRSYEAENNLRRLFDELWRKSDGAIRFNLDTTNGQRPGYFHFLEFGNIFLENRYVCYDWAPSYSPEKTLQSLWRLSRYLRIQSLQIEVPSPEDVNAALLSVHPDPRVYPVEYWAAIALFANPLLWLAPSRVSPAMRERIRGMMALHRQYRERIFAGETFPVGEEPSGRAMTGFHNHNFRDGSGLILIFREQLSTSESLVFSVDFLPETAVFQRLSGQGEISRTGQPGELRVTIPAPAMFLFCSY